MWSKLSRLSYNQLVVLGWLAAHPAEFGEVRSLARATPLKSKSLGGVLSSLSRAKFRGLSLIEPWGRAKSGPGLRWKMNESLVKSGDIKKEVTRLLSQY